MTRRFYVVISAALILVFFSAALAADVIVFKNGKIVEGTIVEETDDLVAVELESGGKGAYSKDDIRTINGKRIGVARGRVVEVTGVVEALAQGETEWKPVEEGMELDEGYSIRSGPDSKVIAVFAETVIMAIEQNSEIDLDKLEKSRKVGIDIQINLGQGQIWNDVGKLRSKRSKFNVETPQAVTGVRGTVFTVVAAPDAITRVAVVQGNVDVTGRGVVMTPTRVAENNMTEVAANMAPTPPTEISGEFLAQWKEYKSKFSRIRLQMSLGWLGDLPMPILLVAAGVAILIVGFVLSRLFKRRK